METLGISKQNRNPNNNHTDQQIKPKWIYLENDESSEQFKHNKYVCGVNVETSHSVCWYLYSLWI